MRTFVLKTAIAAGLLCIASFAQAQTTFNITGTITMGTCQIAVANTDVGTFNASLFTGSYQSGFKPITVAVSNCAPGITKVTLKPTGTADANNANYWSSKLPGAPFELRDPGGAGILPPSGLNNIVINSPSMTGAPTNYTLQAQFHQTAVLQSGSIGGGSATVTLAATYN